MENSMPEYDRAAYVTTDNAVVDLRPTPLNYRGCNSGQYEYEGIQNTAPVCVKTLAALLDTELAPLGELAQRALVYHSLKYHADNFSGAAIAAVKELKGSHGVDEELTLAILGQDGEGLLHARLRARKALIQALTQLHQQYSVSCVKHGSSFAIDLPNDMRRYQEEAEQIESVLQRMEGSRTEQ